MRKFISLTLLSLLLASFMYAWSAGNPKDVSAASYVPTSAVRVVCYSETAVCHRNSFKIQVTFPPRVKKTVSGKKMTLCWMGNCKTDRSSSNKYGYSFIAAQLGQSGVRRGNPTWVDVYMGGRHIVHRKVRVWIGCSPFC